MDGLFRDLARECHRAGAQIAFDDAVHDARGERVPRRKGRAEGAHLDRFCETGQARQSLRAAHTGDQSQLHFGLAHLRRGRDRAVMPRHGDFEAPAQRRAVDRHHHRLDGVFDRAHHR